ncbi:MAG: dienelactone hydrolase family protein [Gemmatimonadaceae bacterium]
MSVSGPVPPGKVFVRTMTLDAIQYPYAVYVPTTYDSTVALPSLLLVHGAGGDGLSFIGNWISYAEANRILLVAPTLDLSANAETRVPIVFPALMDAVKKEWNVDPARRYLFGYSAGGYFVYDAALLNSDYFAAAAVFAAVIQPEYDGIASQATRKTGIAIYLGDHDPYFTLQQGRRTRDLLISNGIDVRYVELADQDHDYSAVSATVNDDAWRFMIAHSLR